MANVVKQLPDTIQKHLRHRAFCEAAFAEVYRGIPERYSLAGLHAILQETDEEAMADVFGVGEHLEILLNRLAWWMTVCDFVAYEAGAQTGSENAEKTRNLLLRAQAIFAEAIALVPVSWGETYSSRGDNFGMEAGLRLIRRYLEFRQGVVDMVEAAWPDADLSEIKSLD